MSADPASEWEMMYAACRDRFICFAMKAFQVIERWC